MSKPPRKILSPNKVFNNEHPTQRVPIKMPFPRVSSPLQTITKAIINNQSSTTQSIQKPIKQGRNHRLSKQSYDKKSMNQKIAEPKSHSKLTCKFDSRNMLNVLNSFVTTKWETTSIIGNWSQTQNTTRYGPPQLPISLDVLPKG